MKIDVIIPVYNGEKYIEEALKSVLTQTRLPDKIYVVDDGSTDNTAKIIAKLQKHNARIEYYHQQNKGLGAARNAGIKISKNNFLAFLDADDVWTLDKLAKQVEVFQRSKDKKLGCVYCDYFEITAAGEKLSNISKFDPAVKGKLLPRLFRGNFIAGSGSAVLVKRECFLKIGYFDEGLPAAEDWDMWVRIAQKYNFDYTWQKLVGIRRHGQNLQNNVGRMAVGEARLFSKWLGKYRIDEQCLSVMRYRLAKRLISGFPQTNVYKIYQRELSYLAKKVLLNNFAFWKTTAFLILKKRGAGI